MKIGKLLSLIKFRITSKSKKDGATLGVMPDYGYPGPGMRLGSISSGKTAEKYDFKEGDVITRIGGQDVADLMGYMSVLNEYSVGDEVDIDFLRDGQQHKVAIQFT